MTPTTSRVPAWVRARLAKVLGAPRPEADADAAWLDRIPAAPAPDGLTSVFGTHIATNRAQCPFTYLATLAGSDTRRLDHGVMRDRTPDAVYTRDPVLTRRVLQNRANPKTHGWYRFHGRMFDYTLPRDILMFSSADEPMVGAIRKAYAAGLADALQRRQVEIETRIERWVERVVVGRVDIARATRLLVADLLHLVAFGEPPANAVFGAIYGAPEAVLVDAKRRLAHLLWPGLDRIPTPYTVFHRTRALAFRWATAYYFNRYRRNPDSLLAWLQRTGDTDGHADFAWQTLPFLLNAANGTLPYPMVMTLYLLAEHPEVQERVVREGLYGAALKETMRLYPTLTSIARIVTERVESDTTVIEPMASDEGQLFMNPMGVHRHPRGWSRPDEFVIDRWLPGWHDDLEADYRVFMPFGLGARSCVGAAFATKLLETFLRIVLSRRIVTNPDGASPRIVEGSLVFVRPPFRLHFAPRFGGAAG